MSNQVERRALFEKIHNTTLSPREVIIFDVAYGFGVMDTQMARNRRKARKAAKSGDAS